MTTAEQMVGDHLVRRIERLYARFDETGDDRYLIAAEKSEAAWQRLMARNP